MGKSLRVKKGNEVFEIQDTDLQAAVNDGYLPTDTVIVANSKTNEVYEIDPKDLPSAFKDGFSFKDVKKKIGSPLGGKVGSSVGRLDVGAWITEIDDKGKPVGGALGGGLGTGLNKKPSIYIPETNIEEYNASMKSKLGLPKLNLGSDLPQIKREREAKEYQELRNIEETEIKPFEASVFTGTVQPSQIKNLANKPYGKKLVNDVLRQYAPEAGGLSLDENVFGSDKNAEQVANVLQQKFRQQGIEAQNQYLYNLDKEVYDNLNGLKRTDVNVSGGTGGAATGVSEANFPSIDTNSPVELGKALEFLSGGDGTYFELNGKRLTQEEISGLSRKINEKLFAIKAGEPIHPEILSQELSGKLLNAVSNVDAEWKKNIGYSPEQKQQFIQKDFQYAEEGLNFLRDANRSAYNNIVGGILKKEKIADTDYEQLVSIGKRLESEKKFRNGDFLVDDNRDFRTYQTLKAEEAGALSEKIKQMGYKNKAKVADNVIVKAAIELGIDPNSQRVLDIRRDEASGGYGIVKGGGLTAFMRGLAQPVKSIQSTFQAIFNDPTTTYLNSRRYDYGDQIVPDKEGNYTNVLPSERGYKDIGNIFNKILEGTGQLTTQVLTSRLGGQLISAPYRAATLSVPRAALTGSQATNIAAYGGGGLSTLAQTYGSSYIDFLNKTGNPNKASFMALVDATAQSVIEVGVLPDVKLAESMKDIWQNAKRNLATDIMKVVEKGGGKEAAQPFIKKFAQKSAEIWGKEVIGEEGLQNLTNYLTEAFFSPKTAQSRNLSKETVNVIKDASLSMAVPVIVGGFAAGKSNRKLTQDALNTAAQNFDTFADAIENGRSMGVIAPQDADTALEIIKVHQQSLDKAPKQDANGEAINAARQIEYAFQNTVEEVAKAKLAKETDEVQQEPLKKQIEEAKEIKRKIFNGTEISTLPKEEKTEQPTIDQDRVLGDEEQISQPIELDPNLPEGYVLPTAQLTPEQKIIQQAIDNNEVDGMFLDMAKAALSDPQQAKQLLDEAKSQATGQVAGELGSARSGVEKAWGKTIADFVAPQEPTQETPTPTDKAGETTVREDFESKKADIERRRQEELLGKSFTQTTERVVTGKGQSAGKTVVRFTESKISSDGEVLTIKPKAKFKNEDTPLSTTPETITVKEFREQFYENLSEQDKEMFDEFFTDDSTRIKLVEARIGLKGNVKGQVNIDVESLEGQPFGFELQKGKEINAKYDAELAALEQPTPTDKAGEQVGSVVEGKEQPTQPQVSTVREEEPIPQPTKAKELADKGIGKYEKKAREIADKIQKSELPDWLKADLPDGTKKAGSGYDQLKKALADAVIEMGRLLDKGVEYSQAIKQAVKELVSLQGEENRDTIEKGFEKYYTDQTQQQPPTPTPPKQEPKEVGGDIGGKKKAVLNRLYNAKNVPQSAKEGFEREGLTYKPKSQKEAAEIAKSVVDEFGVDEAVELADSSSMFEGDVRTLIFAEALDRLQGEENAAKWAEVAIAMDKFERSSGRAASAVNYFYKNNPYGVQLKEEADRKEAFDKWATSKKEKSWKEFFEEFKKDPEFNQYFKEQVYEELKKERAKSRQGRIKKVRDIFAKAKASVSGKGAVYSAIIPPKIITGALDVMEKAYEAGEAVVEVVQRAIDYINKEFGTSWDSEKFREEWEDKLKEPTKAPLTEEEFKKKVLDRFRNRLKGLSDKQRDEVVRRMFDKVVNAGALEYDDLRDIIADVLGYGKLTAEEGKRLQELVKKRNAVGEAAKKAQEERTDKALEEYRLSEIEAGKAARELQELLWNKPDIIKRLTSIMQLSTLGIPSLINNPVYNFFNQLGVRFPVGLINSTIDKVGQFVANKMGKNYVREYNIFDGQAEFWAKLGVGSKEAVQQLFTGLNRQDYIQKEYYGQQIRPMRAIRDLIRWKAGEKKLTKAQVIDKALQASVGIPAEVVARFLNVGDKPQRFAAEGSQAAAFAKALGLKDIDKKLFIEFPKEEAYRAYKAQGLSDEAASTKSEYIKEAIIKEGQRSTFQQDNVLNDMITGAFGRLGGKDSGLANLIKSLVVSPYIKIPTNAFWSYYNLVNPEVAILQSFYHAGRAKMLSNKGDEVAAKLQSREARYWLAHALTGMAMRGLVVFLVQAGIFVAGNTGDESKKEREAESFFEQPGTLNISKLWALMRGEDPKKVKNGVLVSNRWFGQFGTLGNSIMRKWEDMTPEQRENQQQFWNIAFGGMELEALKEMENGIFANTSSLLDVVNTGDFSRYGLNTINMFTNILQPASIAQINRASLNEVPQAKGDTFLEKLNQNFAQRSSLYRKAFDVQLQKKRSIWGEPIPKGGNILSRMFGIFKIDEKKEGRPMYEDYLRTNDSGFLPPAVLPTMGKQKLNQEQYNKLQDYIGQSRKAIALPYIDDKAIIPVIGKKYSELNDKDGKPNDELRKAVLQYLYELGRDNGVAKFYQDYPEFKKPEKSVEEQVQESLLQSALELIKLQNKQ